jgi:hypothetical protein
MEPEGLSSHEPQMTRILGQVTSLWISRFQNFSIVSLVFSVVLSAIFGHISSHGFPHTSIYGNQVTNVMRICKWVRKLNAQN